MISAAILNQNQNMYLLKRIDFFSCLSYFYSDFNHSQHSQLLIYTILNYEFWIRFIFCFFYISSKCLEEIEKSNICSLNSLLCSLWQWESEIQILYSLYNFLIILYKYQFQYVNIFSKMSSNWCQNLHESSSNSSTWAIKTALFSSKIVQSNWSNWCSSLWKTAWLRHN